jgi:hypothetical protein
MQVNTKLVKMQLEIGSIQRDADRIIIKSDPTKSMPATVYLTPQDVASMIKASLNLSVISYILLFPIIYVKSRKKEAAKS